MNDTTLHYVYDPLCGWCYGAAPLLQAAAGIPDLRIALHAGGLWLGARRQRMGQALRDYVRPHDERIHALTGQPFGKPYFDELLLDESRLLDSEPPIRAVLAVSELGGDGLTLLHRIQETHYRDGEWVGSPTRLAALALEQGVTPEAFALAFGRVDLSGHLATSQAWLQRLGGQGFPTLGLMRGGSLLPVSVSTFLGEPTAFVDHLASLMAG
ncbi:DsbA family protein [Aeromonas sp. SrichE-2G]|uniref:DsbA family protein n=1 Tax=Aeromonas sp. SrichE-2G TaxID=2823359 RepID=UPI001B33024D|nr:DsbA family protein [Aeromonas sp. SrichE-2G]MBP4042865.1 DsbA family protein [Aeromonas sp. SrichE-2G]